LNAEILVFLLTKKYTCFILYLKLNLKIIRLAEVEKTTWSMMIMFADRLGALVDFACSVRFFIIKKQGFYIKQSDIHLSFESFLSYCNSE